MVFPESVLYHISATLHFLSTCISFVDKRGKLSHAISLGGMIFAYAVCTINPVPPSAASRGSHVRGELSKVLCAGRYFDPCSHTSVVDYNYPSRFVSFSKSVLVWPPA